MHRDVHLMDSKVVSQEIKRRIWASLKTMGFDMFTSRTAWRHGTDTIDVFNLQSFSKYDADVLDITTFSFRVNLGRYLAYITPQWPPKIKAGKQVPEEHRCHCRGRLFPSGVEGAFFSTL
jgi:hypothetical protein